MSRPSPPKRDSAADPAGDLMRLVDGYQVSPAIHAAVRVQ